MVNFPLNRNYNEAIRQLETTDKVHADTFNPLFNQLINNAAAHKDRLDAHDASLAQKANLSDIDTTIKGCINTIKKLNAKSTVKGVCLGDSVTYGYVGGNQAANPYPLSLQTKLQYVYGYSDITITNSGVPGDTTSGALSNFQSRVLQYNPDFVIIMFGLNDVHSIALSDYENNLKSMISQCKANNIEVILCSPTQAFLGSDRDDITNYAEKCRQVAIAMKTSFVDMFNEFRQWNENNYIPLNTLGDDTHLQASDYYLLGDMILANVLVPYTYKDLKSDSVIIPVSSNNVYSVGTNTYKSTYMKTGQFTRLVNTTTDTIRVAVFTRKDNKYSLNLLYATNHFGTIAIEKEGQQIKSVNGTKASNSFDEKAFVCDLSRGFNFIEFKATNVTGGTSDGLNTFAIEGFEIVPNSISNAVYQNTSATNDQTVQILGKVFDNLSCKSPSALAAATAKVAFLTDYSFALKDNKSLVLEFDMTADGYGGFGWFATKPYVANNYNYGYWVRFNSTSGIDLWYSQTNLKSYSTPITLGQSYKIRVEHSASGVINVYINGTLAITQTDTNLISGNLFFVLGQGATYVNVKNLYYGYI